MVRIVQRLLKPSRQTAAAFLAFFVASLIFTAGAQAPPATGLNSIRADELRQKVTYIASETFKGRGNGTPELDMAAQYIAGVFEKNGLRPAGDDQTYFQKFFIYSSRLGPENRLRINGQNGAIDLQVRSDFIPELWSSSGNLSGSLELVNGSAKPGSLNGKIAVVMEERIVSDDPEFPANAVEGRRQQEAGALAVLVVQSERSSRIASMAENFRDDLPVRLTQMAGLNVPDYPDIPVVVLSGEAGRRLLTELRRPNANVTASISVDVQRKLHETQNVLGLIEGSDAAMRNDVVIVGAHYDHDGEAFGQIWYGADDNGSGTAALLELAEAWGTGAARMQRSVLLIAWAGEEKGLLGSRYYVNHPRFPLDRTVSMFQMDMIGRNEDHAANRSQQVPEERAADNVNSLNVLGTAFSPELKNVVSRANSQVSLNLHFRYDFGAEELMRRSDQWSFLQRGVPALFFFAGLHPDYHTPRDTPEKINYPKLEKAARLVYLSTQELATSSGKPQYVKASASGQKPY